MVLSGIFEGQLQGADVETSVLVFSANEMVPSVLVVKDWEAESFAEAYKPTDPNGDGIPSNFRFRASWEDLGQEKMLRMRLEGSDNWLIYRER
jgi:hypothetical protein